MILSYIFESYLDLRQHAAHKLPNLPKTLEGVISQEKFEKSRAYSLDKRFVSVFLLSLLGSLHALFILLTLRCSVLSLFSSYFHFVHEFFTIFMDSMILYYGILPWFWKVSGCICELWWTSPTPQLTAVLKIVVPVAWFLIVITEIGRISTGGWPKCREWDNADPCVLSWFDDLVTGADIKIITLKDMTHF